MDDLFALRADDRVSARSLCVKELESYASRYFAWSRVS
jgi:hypothetical protein